MQSEERARLLLRAEADLGGYLDKVRPIIEAVRERGDAALSEFAKQFDGAPVPAAGIRVGEEEIERGCANVPAELAKAILFARDNILRYHQTQLPKPMMLTPVAAGVLAGERWSAIPSVACYVPRGKGSFPSVSLMTLIPAVVAKVPRIALITPPGPDGRVDDATLFVARAVGAKDIYKCGGAQAVAAVAYGTATVPKCDKIVGPGSPWVVAAKQLLARQIDPGPPAGPSEAIVLADSTANAWKAALDLVNESEHGPDSSAFLVTPDAGIADLVDAYVPRIWERQSEGRRAFSRTVLTGKRGGIVLTRDMDEAVAFTNDYAAEHLQVHSADPFSYVERIINAGEILLGEHAAICLGNFVLGPNAVLPTAGAARTASPLSVYDYLKRTSLVHVTKAGYPPLAEAARTLAEYEGFDGHALAVSPWRDTPPK
ncbi:MAG: histidinol dehydrogenase [Hyphomicrobiaceae bacterium]